MTYHAPKKKLIIDPRGPHVKPEKRLEEGYREMAGDAEHEQEAAEWCEALIGDSSEAADSSLRSE